MTEKTSQDKIDDLMGGSGFSLPKELREDLLRIADQKKAQFEGQGQNPVDAWISTVRDFHQNKFWGFREKSQVQHHFNQQKLTPEKEMFQFVRTFFVPTFVTKVALFYFGIHYSKYPGEGYGYGLLLSVIATVFNLTYFALMKEKRKSSRVSEELHPETQEQ